MHDTDMAGILYFPRQFRFVHDALEDFSDTSGMPFAHIFHKEQFLFVVVHAESDYFVPLHVGDKLEIEVTIAAVGTSSFTVAYKIFKMDKTASQRILSGTAKTTHVTIDSKTRTKIPIPMRFKEFLDKNLEI